MLEQKIFYLVATVSLLLITILLMPALFHLDRTAQRLDEASKKITNDFEHTRDFFRKFDAVAAFTGLINILLRGGKRRTRTRKKSENETR